MLVATPVAKSARAGGRKVPAHDLFACLGSILGLCALLCTGPIVGRPGGYDGGARLPFRSWCW